MPALAAFGKPTALQWLEIEEAEEAVKTVKEGECGENGESDFLIEQPGFANLAALHAKRELKITQSLGEKELVLSECSEHVTKISIVLPVH